MPVWTIGELIKWSVGYLKPKGLESARLDAELLLAETLHQERLYLYLNHDKPLTAEELAGYKELLKRRLKPEPMAYILGRKSFWTLELEVGPGALIPRPDTETLVEAALDRLASGSEAEAVDLGTGCGPIILSLAAERPGLKLTATDISPDALEQCRANAGRLGLAGRIDFLAGDLFEPLKARRFDMILMNPPYVTRSEYGALAGEIISCEPEGALLGGQDGLDVIRRLVSEAPGHLNPGGWLIFEIGAGQGGAVGQLLNPGPWAEVEILPDLCGRDRVAAARFKP